MGVPPGVAQDYTLRVVAAAPPGITSASPRSGSRARKPELLTIGRNGDIAIIRPTDAMYLTGARTVFVRRFDGSSETLSTPPSALLTRSFRTYPLQNGKPAFQDIYFASVRIADDGAVIATVASHFWGGYSGIESAAFRWSGNHWETVSPHDGQVPSLSGWPVNTQIAAADSGGTVALNVIYGQQWIPDTAYLNDSNYMLNQVEWTSGKKHVLLGAGTATALAGDRVAGFQAGLNPFGPNAERPHASVAVLWDHRRVRRLGPGVAYDVNAGGEIVGDDETVFGKPGRPVLWRNGKTVLLDRRFGSAYAIGDDGVIVGQIGDSAFVADARSARLAVTLLDARVSDRRWHLIAAYGRDDRGRILALGRISGGAPYVVVLSPRPRR